MESPATKVRRLEHHRSVSDALRPPPSFQIQDLPEEIQQLILSFMPLKDAASASLVSRNWRMLWTGHATLICALMAPSRSLLMRVLSKFTDGTC